MHVVFLAVMEKALPMRAQLPFSHIRFFGHMKTVETQFLCLVLYLLKAALCSAYALQL